MGTLQTAFEIEARNL